MRYLIKYLHWDDKNIAMAIYAKNVNKIDLKMSDNFQIFMSHDTISLFLKVH